MRYTNLHYYYYYYLYNLNLLVKLMVLLCQTLFHLAVTVCLYVNVCGFPFSDKDGRLALSPKQKQQLGKWVRPSEFCEDPCMIYAVSSFSIRQVMVGERVTAELKKKEEEIEDGYHVNGSCMHGCLHEMTPSQMFCACLCNLANGCSL